MVHRLHNYNLINAGLESVGYLLKLGCPCLNLRTLCHLLKLQFTINIVMTALLEYLDLDKLNLSPYFVV